MGNIVLLDELTINKIAAGEVIERPASVIKEMVENSIDAGSSNISIEIKNGGISYIRITDNGKGITPDDIDIAFERHATSKIRNSDDLENVRTMGFRGEALASIAAISNVCMISRNKDLEIGTKIVVEAGKILSKEEIGCPQGTTITVEKLFFNTPVRYKFLKKDFSEGGYIEDTIRRLAIINPNIAFKLISSGKIVVQTSGNNNLKDTLYNIYGNDIATNIIDVDFSYEDMKITGVIGKPEIARSNRTHQMFFVNNRYIKDKTLSSATEQAYKGMLQQGKFSFVILNLKIDTKKVDVNVHPAKLEIRFSDEGKVFKAIYNAIKTNLLNTNLTPEIKIENKIENKIEYEIENMEKIKIEEKIAVTTTEEPEELNIIEQIYMQKQNDNRRGHIVGDPNPNVETQMPQLQPESSTEPVPQSQPQPQTFEPMYEKLFGKKIEQPTNTTLFEETSKYGELKTYKYIGTAFKTYIILEIEQEVYILDQHAAHERTMYEKIKKNYYEEGEKESQIMLLPDIITLSYKEKDILKENIDIFRKSGFILEEFGENAIKLTGVPDLCINLNTKELFLEILDEIDSVAKTAKQEIEEKFISTVACKASVKANKELKPEEVDTLMNSLLCLDNPFTCPHGRPTAIKMSKIDIEKKFGRR